MSIEPFGDRVLLKRLENVTKTAGGLYLPGDAQTKSNQAVVVAVGPGRYSERGELIPMRAKVGDHVVAARHAGEDIKVDGEERWMVRDIDIQYRVRHEEDEA